MQDSLLQEGCSRDRMPDRNEYTIPKSASHCPQEYVQIVCNPIICFRERKVVPGVRMAVWLARRLTYGHKLT